MAEVKTPPRVSQDADDDMLFTFGPEHTLADIARWIVSQGGAEDMMFLLAKLKGERDD